MSPHSPRSPCSCLSYAWVILLLAWNAAAWAAAEVAVVLSENSAPYQEVAEAVRSGLGLNQGQGAQASVRVLPTESLESLRPQELSAIVAVGARATRAAAMSDLRAPVLGTLLPRNTFERIAEESGRMGDPGRFSAVFLDQPTARQLDLIRLALPGFSRIGLLLGPESETLLGAMRDGVAGRRLRIVAQTVYAEKQLFPALQRLQADADVLLALPDQVVFNSATIPNILLTTYRQRLPVVGFSAAYTRAGAVLALYSTPQQIGSQAADMLRSALAKGLLPPPQYPREFAVSANPHVARSLGLVIDDASSLTQKLREAEAR